VTLFLDRDVQALREASAAAGPEVVARADRLAEALDALPRTAALI
jgi:hypothetical protein